MSSSPAVSRFSLAVLAVFLLATTITWAQTAATLQGTVMDASGAVIPHAQVTAINQGTNLQRTTQTDSTGNYQIAALPAGTYRVEVQAPGLQRQTVTNLALDVSRTVAQNFKLKPATLEQAVTITAESPVVESSTMTVGQVMDPRQIQEIPLNGRHFVDLGLLVPGSVTPPANGFLTAPIRGQGSLAINTAGQREDTVNFMVNGINLADMANGQITFQPSLATLSEFKVDNQTYSAEAGRNSGAVVNMATRSGTNTFHGEAFEYLRNNYFDARNFFNKDSTRQAQFIRHDFGGDIGGPIIRDKLFFFGSYEGLRQRQGIALSSTVLNATQRSQALASPSPAIQKLVALIPPALPGTNQFLGSSSAPVLLDQWTGDVSFNLSGKDHLHGYYAIQRDSRIEPIDACSQPNPPGCATLPGFGDSRNARRQLMTFNESHVFNSRVVNEFRLGYNRIHITFDPTNQLDPTTFGINDGHSGNFGLPEIIVTNIGLDFGGQLNFPQGRADLTSVISDSVSWLRGRHSFKFGWEGRQVNDNPFRHDQTRVTFNNVDDFIGDRVAAFVSNGDTVNHIVQRALGAFAMDSFKLAPSFTLELGLRYEWNMTPFETQNLQSEFIPATAQLVQVGSSSLPRLYNQNNKNFEPRVGFAWDLWKNGKTILRAGYGWAADQPLPIALTANPPFTNSLNFNNGITSLEKLTADAGAAGLSLASGTVDHNFRNPYVQSYNLNLQQELTPSMALTVGYFGAKGTHLRQNINLNQPFYTNLVTGKQANPFPAISASSPIAPGLKLVSSITEITSAANSNYNALWLTLNRHFANGLQFSSTYTWSKSLDDSSRVNSPAVGPENSLNIGGDYGPSDFDARHRFVFSGTYDLPFKGNRLMSGWRLGGIVTLQTGNPLNITAGAPATICLVPATPCPKASTLTGSATLFTGTNTNRPDLIGPVNIVNQIISNGNVQWIAPNSVCDPRLGACAASAIFALPVALSSAGVNIYHFGNLSRNALVGPNFHDVDFSLTKTTRITERLSNELRVEAFDLFNHPNFGNPNTTASTSGTFGVISSTRIPTGDAGGSRQLQFAVKLIF